MLSVTPNATHYADTSEQIERLLDRHCLQVYGRNGWYDVRRNGQTKRWVRRSHLASVPVRLGLRECFRIEVDNSTGKATVGFAEINWRERPDTFDPRNRRQ